MHKSSACQHGCQKKKIEQICSNWPSVVPDNIIFKCLANYRCHTVWTPPHICCVCGLQCKEVIMINISDRSSPSLDFSILHVQDSFITDISDFHWQYSSDMIDNCILDTLGFKQCDEQHIVLQVCNDCSSALNKKCLPRFSLANHFYRGKLPNKFGDLTWVEEMICAKYQNMVHVTRIYRSSDPSQPKVFHGNTCVCS